jgi:hypothetical protein
MPDYRIYFVGWTGHFSDARDLECQDDQDAIEKASQLLDAEDIQLWQRDRHIATLSAKKKQA